VLITQAGHSAPFNSGPQGDQKDQYSNYLPPYQTIKSWALWLLSVVCASVLISSSKLSGYLAFKKHPIVIETPLENQRPAPMKRSKCATGGVGDDTYDLPLHVAALFVILATSTIACAFPILATRFPRLRIPPSFLFFVSHFGTGVLIATAFVHLLPTAFTSLGDPCLSNFWTTDYPAMPGAIALGGIFIVTLAEMVFSPAQHICRSGKSNTAKQGPSSGFDKEETPGGLAPGMTEARNSARSQDQSSYLSTLDGRAHLRDMGPLIGRSSSISRAMNRVGDGSEEIVRVASAPEIPTHREKDLGAIHEDIERHEHSFELTPEQKQKKETMQVYLLEMGILFHSVFIGMSLSVSIGNEFVILLIAIVFHRVSDFLLSFLLIQADHHRLQKPLKALLWGRALLHCPGLKNSFNPGSCHSHMDARKSPNLLTIFLKYNHPHNILVHQSDRLSAWPRIHSTVLIQKSAFYLSVS
jgi:zinc transporter ZupT